jgi:hypothetical protein
MWDEAVKRYETITKKSLKQIPWPSSPEDLIRDVEGSVKQCEEFLGRAATFFTIFRNVGGTIATVGNVVAGAAQGAFPASPMIFGCVVYLIDAAKGVSRCLDAITDLLQILQNFTVRLKIYDMVEISELHLSTSIANTLNLLRETSLLLLNRRINSNGSSSTTRMPWIERAKCAGRISLRS